jgi:hypothetical protein
VTVRTPEGLSAVLEGGVSKERAARIGSRRRAGTQVRKFVAAIGVVFVLTACAASAGSSKVQRPFDSANCTWGASSITASYVNGQVVESEPQIFGCT